MEDFCCDYCSLLFGVDVFEDVFDYRGGECYTHALVVFAAYSVPDVVEG